MNYKPIPFYDEELGLAGITDSTTGISVYSLVMQPGEKKAAIMAYIGARYSRSSDSIVVILKEVLTKFGGLGASKRIESIVQGYGHASVADMSHNMIFVEQVSMVTAMRFFYLNPKQDGQERSTRFQDFSAPTFYPCANADIASEYYQILNYQITGYNMLLEETRSTFEKYFKVDITNKAQESALTARTFDTLRHLLPMGMRTNFCGIMSSRDWAKYIGWMRGSSQGAERVLGEMLFNLLVGTEELFKLGYMPESDSLIKYADPNSGIEETTQKLIETFNNNPNKRFAVGGNNGVFTINPVNQFFNHIALLTIGEPISHKNGIDEVLLENLGNIIFSSHNDRKQLGPIFQSGSLMFRGILDIGAMKDFNRHRSTERFISWLDNCIDPDVIMNNGFRLCDYLEIPEMSNLKVKYVEHLNSVYEKIAELRREKSVDLEHLRYLLPHAHETNYQIYASLDDVMYIQNLRLRPGGHINYRMETRRWCDYMINSEIPGLKALWTPLSKNLPIPDPSNAQQFLDRS